MVFNFDATFLLERKVAKRNRLFACPLAGGQALARRWDLS